MEAMAARLPVVATAVGGVPELVEHGVTGMLIPAADAAALAAGLADLAGNPAKRREFADAARRRASQFDAGAMVERYAALFERVCQGKSQCRAS
jgi:2-deoxystreptamine N-acetyl-D-glucosaminyltransferase/2-deoxystreptamine glucosyltransferase